MQAVLNIACYFTDSAFETLEQSIYEKLSLKRQRSDT